MSADHSPSSPRVLELDPRLASAQLSSARSAGDRVWRVDLGHALGKQGVLAAIADALSLPAHFGGNWDALYDCLTDLEPPRGETGLAPRGLRLHLGSVPRPPRFSRDDREQLLSVLEDAAAFHAEHGRACIISWSWGAD